VWDLPGPPRTLGLTEISRFSPNSAKRALFSEILSLQRRF
jgi:hypothetical protein